MPKPKGLLRETSEASWRRANAGECRNKKDTPGCGAGGPGSPKCVEKAGEGAAGGAVGGTIVPGFGTAEGAAGGAIGGCIVGAVEEHT
jgi:hypothetical protein